MLMADVDRSKVLKMPVSRPDFRKLRNYQRDKLQIFIRHRFLYSPVAKRQCHLTKNHKNSNIPLITHFVSAVHRPVDKHVSVFEPFIQYPSSQMMLATALYSVPAGKDISPFAIDANPQS